MNVLLIQETDWLKRNPHQQHHLAEMLSLREHNIRVIDYEFSWKTEGKGELLSRRQVYDNASKVRDGARIMLIRPGIVKMPILDYASLVFSHKKEIDRQIDEFAPDVIIAFGIINAYLTMRAARRNKIPFIYYWIDVLDSLVPSRVFQPIARIIERRTLKSADQVVVINEKLKERVILMGAATERVSIVGAGIDLTRFNPATDGTPIRKEYGFGNEDIILFFMGWLYRFSGLKEVTEQLVIEGDSNIKLLVVGEGDAYDELKEIVKRHSIAGRVILAGKKPYHEIPSFIAASDICLLPALPDEKIMQSIVPIKIYEYMAMGKPVISTELPGVMKEFGNDSGVIYVQNPEDVVVKATALIQNGSAKELGCKAREYTEKLSWENIADKFEELLKDAIEEKRKS